MTGAEFDLDLGERAAPQPVQGGAIVPLGQDKIVYSDEAFQIRGVCVFDGDANVHVEVRIVRAEPDPAEAGASWLSVDGGKGEKFEVAPQTNLAQTPSSSTIQIRGGSFSAYALRPSASLRGQVMAVSRDPQLSPSGNDGAVLFHGERQSP